MKIEKYKKRNNGRCQIIFDNGEVFDTYEEVIIKFQLFGNKEIDKELYDNIIKETTIQEKYNNCLKYIKIRLRSEKEIRDYLIKKNVNASEIDLIVDRLINNNLLNDEIYCKCFINDKLKFTSQGDYKIKQDLRKSGIDEEIIEKYESLFDRNLLEQKMDKLINKYIKSSKNKNITYLKNKIYNNLMIQGYNVDMILEKLNRLNILE